MGIIHVMDEQLTNLIAAGEVVDRPVNIVKECVENSLDAGASSIDIEVFEGGISGVIVTDDGCGMSYEDAAMAFERHATSKLQSEEDLFSISTMGFRGEALPSIASVARVVLETGQDDQGTRVEVEYGKKVLQEKANVPQGTRIEVTGLFQHTPARFKYLKKANYEYSIIADVVNKMALSHPEVRFTLRHDNRLVFQTSGRKNPKEILFAMFGREVAENAQYFENSSPDFHISGYAVQPKISRASKQFIYLALNGRLIRSWPLANAVIEGYREFLPKDRYPIVYINIETDPQLVDVNVHPNKWEVRISKEEFLSQLIIQTLENLFQTELETPSISIQAKKPAQNHEQLKAEFHYPTGKSPVLTVNEPSPSYGKPDQSSEIHTDPGDLRLKSFEPGNGQKRNEFIEKTDGAMGEWKSQQRQDFAGSTPISYPVRPSVPMPENKPKQEEQPQPSVRSDRGMDFFNHLRVIGQLKDSYILCENPDGLVIIDQHAAQERANFERIQKRMEQSVKYMQPLMVPWRKEVPPALIGRIDSVNESLQPYGLHFEVFGTNSLILREEPDWMALTKRDEFLEDLLSWLQSGQDVDMKELRRHLIATMACHSSIRFNHKLTMDEMHQVIEDLKQCENPYHCPHGRPTVITVSQKELFKEFERG